MLLPCHCCGFPPPPANHPYVSTCGIDGKTISNGGNSASYLLKSSWTEISLMTV